VIRSASCAPSRVSFPSDPLGAETEPPAQAAELVQLGAAQAAHLAHEALHVAGEDGRDQLSSGAGQRHHDEASVVLPALLGDQAAPGEVRHDHRGVAVAPQQLGAEVSLAERAVVQERLQHAELADGQPRLRHHAVDTRGDRLRGPHQLDVRVEGRRLGRTAGVAGRHGSNLNGLYARAAGLVKGAV
jgi:hypothetical protein